MPKQTRLGDDAFIYQPQKKQTEKEKLHTMSFKGKLEYLWEYYKLHALGIVAAIALIIYIIYRLMNPEVSPQLYVAMINNPIKDEVLTQYNNDMVKLLGLNTKRESVEFNTSLSFEDNDTYALSMKEALTAYVGAKEVDVIIAPESQFQYCVKAGYIGKLSDKLPTDIYSSLTNQFYITSTEDDPEKSAYGIYLNDTKLYKGITYGKEHYLLGIVANDPHEDNTLEFVRYLFNEK